MQTWKMPGWMYIFREELSVTNIQEIREIMNSPLITYTGEKLRCEVALLERLHRSWEIGGRKTLLEFKRRRKERVKEFEERHAAKLARRRFKHRQKKQQQRKNKGV